MPNLSGSSPHIGDADLIQFADGELPVKAVTAAETHLRTCNKCRARLDQLKGGAAAYDEYHSHFLKPALGLPQEWSSLHDRLESFEKPPHRWLPPATMWWAAAVLAGCAILIGWLLYHQTPAQRMQQVLARALVVQTTPHRRLLIIANGRSWYRAATLEDETARRPAADQPGLEDTRALFVKANYSWDDPLSARSFAAWRKQLTNKRDQVLSIQDRDGNNRFYRLQTETPTGVLRSAALTLRADTLNPVRGAFHFEHQNAVIIDDAGEMPELPKELETKKNQPVERPPVIKEVSPAEELRVFSALNAIGADVGEPVTVNIDTSKQQIVIVGLGLPADRERQIRQALAPISNLTMRFTSGQPVGTGNEPPRAASYASNNSAPLRHTLEAQAGGAQQLQQLTDKALDASAAILAQANALHVLSQKFPPSVAATFSPPEQETLRSLRRRHAVAIEQATAELKDTLKPLINSTTATIDETQSQPATSWEVGAAQLYEQAKLLDASLGRILAGSYSLETGQSIWSKLPDEIQKTGALARSQEGVR
jgi:hypothetical protein